MHTDLKLGIDSSEMELSVVDLYLVAACDNKAVSQLGDKWQIKSF